MITQFEPEVMNVEDLKPHPRNYRGHPEDQLEHIAESIRQNGFYRNVVIAKDGTILAGHGVTLACKKMGLQTIPVVRLDIEPDSPAALKVLAGDNEISNLGEIDDRALTEMLKEISETDVTGLLGTGFDSQMLANLIMVTRPASEIADSNAAAEWVGAPEYDEEAKQYTLSIHFATTEDREQFVEELGTMALHKATEKVWSTHWPFAAQDDPASVVFVAEESETSNDI